MQRVRQVSHKIRLKDVTFTRGSKPIRTLLWCDTVPKAKRNKPAKLNGVLLSDVQVFHILWQLSLCPLPLDFPPILCHTTYMTDTAPNRSALITALYNEYKFLCHDDFDPDVDPTPDEYLLMIQHLSDD